MGTAVEDRRHELHPVVEIALHHVRRADPIPGLVAYGEGENSRVLKEFAPGVGIAMLADSSIQIAVKPWVKVPDYGPAGDEIYRSIVERFRAAKVEIPFPQREVRLLNSAA